MHFCDSGIICNDKKTMLKCLFVNLPPEFSVHRTETKIIKLNIMDIHYIRLSIFCFYDFFMECLNMMGKTATLLLFRCKLLSGVILGVYIFLQHKNFKPQIPGELPLAKLKIVN